jgi:hypothetical protein
MDFRLLQKSEVLLSALMQVYEVYTVPRLVRSLAVHAVAQFVDSLRCSPEGRDFFPDGVTVAHYGPGVDSASNRNEHQEYLLGVKATDA